jgi:tRNA uridine 5-carboxymethylaminomethyl modification enzyme
MVSGFTEKYDVVVGARHAECEAAMAARMGLKTALYTINLDLIAQMYCDVCLASAMCHRCPHL